jgi:hypothetical protein
MTAALCGSGAGSGVGCECGSQPVKTRRRIRDGAVLFLMVGEG